MPVYESRDFFQRGSGFSYLVVEIFFWTDNSTADHLGYEMQASRTYRFSEKR